MPRSIFSWDRLLNSSSYYSRREEEERRRLNRISQASVDREIADQQARFPTRCTCPECQPRLSTRESNRVYRDTWDDFAEYTTYGTGRGRTYYIPGGQSTTYGGRGIWEDTYTAINDDISYMYDQWQTEYIPEPVAVPRNLGTRRVALDYPRHHQVSWGYTPTAITTSGGNMPSTLTLTEEYIAPSINEGLRNEALRWIETRPLTRTEKHSLTRSLNTFLSENDISRIRFLGIIPTVHENEDTPDETYRFSVADVSENWSGSLGEVDIRTMTNLAAPLGARRKLAAMLPSWAEVSPRSGQIVVKGGTSAGRFKEARVAIAQNWGTITSGMTLGDVERIASALRTFESNRLGTYRTTLAAMPVAAEPAKAVLSDEQRARKFGQYISARKLAPAHELDILQLPIAPVGRDKPASRTWGIEIEHVDAVGISAPGRWDSKYDGSLNGAEPDNDFDNYGECREFVSPVMHKVHSRKMSTLLGQLGERRKNDTPGVHVHVGADDLTLKEQAALVRNYALIEPIIEPIYQRSTREYCRPFSNKDIFTAVLHSGKKSKRAVREGNRFRYEMESNRYVSLNLHALDQHGTVEFRAMGPVYDYESLVRWARFCREFVNLVKLDLPQKRWESLKSWKDILDLIAEHGAESADAVS